MSELGELLERYRRGPELVAAAATGAAGAELDYVPGPGKWSVRQILCHVADAEIVAGERFRRLIAEENPTLVAYDQDAWARNLDYGRRKVVQALSAFRQMRAGNYELLKSLAEEAFARKGVHSEKGPTTLLDQLRVHARHAEAHADQIRAVRSAYRESKSK
ncbi:MAG: DinB family protein [Bryobacteraceae bacterium]